MAPASGASFRAPFSLFLPCSKFHMELPSMHLLHAICHSVKGSCSASQAISHKPAIRPSRTWFRMLSWFSWHERISRTPRMPGIHQTMTVPCSAGSPLGSGLFQGTVPHSSSPPLWPFSPLPCSWEMLYSRLPNPCKNP